MSLGKISGNRGDTLVYEASEYKYTRSDNPASNFSIPLNLLRGAQTWSDPTPSPWRPLYNSTSKWRNPTGYGFGVAYYIANDYSLSINYGGDANRVDTYSYPSTYESAGSNDVGIYFTGRWPECPPNDIASCVTGALNDLSNSKGEFGADLLQMKQTANALGDVSATFASLLQAARRGRFGSRLWGYTDVASRSWLQWKYGWEPLAQDLYNLVNELRERSEPAQLITSRKSASSEENRQYRVELGDNWDTSCSYRTRVQLTGQLPRASMQQFARSANEWGFVNPLSLAWEVVPWSFVVDWFLPVGNVLSALTDPLGLDFVSGFISRTAQGTRNDFRVKSIRPGIEMEPLGPIRTDTKRFAFRREPYLGFPAPMLYTTSPFSTTHCLNALALVRQLI